MFYERGMSREDFSEFVTLLQDSLREQSHCWTSSVNADRITKVVLQKIF